MDAEINAASNTGTILSAFNNAVSNTFICMAESTNFVPFGIDFDKYIKCYTKGVKCDKKCVNFCNKLDAEISIWMQ